MADYALFLRAKFNSKTGNFEDNVIQRQPDHRFWDRVVLSGTTLKAVSAEFKDRINADTRTMELVSHPELEKTDRVYFAVRFTPSTIEPSKIRFMCGLHQAIRASKSKTASPFRKPDGNPDGEVQCDLESASFKEIDVMGDKFVAIGPYSLVVETGSVKHDCCFYKLTVVASATSGSVTREFAYDPDMDVETGL